MSTHIQLCTVPFQACIYAVTAIQNRMLDRNTAQAVSMKDSIEIGPISFDVEARSFRFKGQAIYLTLKESEILAALVANASGFVTGTQLSRVIHGGEHINLRSLNTLMYTLRKKISCIDDNALSIISEGSNYALIIRKDVDTRL